MNLMEAFNFNDIEKKIHKEIRTLIDHACGPFKNNKEIFNTLYTISLTVK